MVRYMTDPEPRRGECTPGPVLLPQLAATAPLGRRGRICGEQISWIGERFTLISTVVGPLRRGAGSLCVDADPKAPYGAAW